MRKKYKFIITFPLIFIILSVFPLAHQGNTDYYGGHYVSGTNNYHYHHGYSAHTHPNGICPYRQSNTENTVNNSFQCTNTPSRNLEKDVRAQIEKDMEEAKSAQTYSPKKDSRFKETIKNIGKIILTPLILFIAYIILYEIVVLISMFIKFIFRK